MKVALGRLLAAFATLASACGGLPGAQAPGGLALATTTIFADIAQNVAGDRFRVESIAPAGAEVEEYEPKPDDAKRVAHAKVVFVNGLELDRWSEQLLKGSRAMVTTLTDGLSAVEGNPHLWFDVQLAKKYVEKIRVAFTELDAAGKDGYAQRARDYSAKLDALDAELRSKVATIPQARRVLVTSHDALPYFAKAYGFTVVGFAQIEPGKDPSPAELAELIQKVRKANVPAIFSEQGVSPRLAQTLAREAGVRSVVTDLPVDSLTATPPADTYIGLMRTIVDKMVAALT